MGKPNEYDILDEAIETLSTSVNKIDGVTSGIGYEVIYIDEADGVDPEYRDLDNIQDLEMVKANGYGIPGDDGCWGFIEIHSGKHVSELWVRIEYKNQQEMLEKITKIFSDVFRVQMLEKLKSGDICDLSFRVGQFSFAGDCPEFLEDYLTQNWKVLTEKYVKYRLKD